MQSQKGSKVGDEERKGKGEGRRFVFEIMEFRFISVKH